VRRPVEVVRPSAVGGPLVVDGRTAAAVARMSAEEVIAVIERHEASTQSNAYSLGVCLRELSQPKRYKDELRFQTFEELLTKRELPSRVTAFKLISVVSTFTETEVTQLGGPEKTYALIRYAKVTRSDPRRFATPHARILGTTASRVSVRDINEAIRSNNTGETAPSLSAATKKAAKKASSQLSRALKRSNVKHRMRIHAHGDTCITVHFDVANANVLTGLLKRLKTLEKQSVPR
jgi:hypothetical protein